MSTNMFDVLAKALQDSQSSLLDDAQRIKDQVSAKELKNAGIVIPEPKDDKEAEQIEQQVKAKVTVHEELVKTVPKYEPEQMELATKIGQIMKQVKEGQRSQEEGRQAIADLVQQAQQEQLTQKTNSTSASGPADVKTTSGGWAPKDTTTQVDSGPKSGFRPGQ